MLPPRPAGYVTSRGTKESETPLPEVYLPGSSQLRSRVLGKDEHNAMLALGLVRAAGRTWLALEPKLLRASELLLSLGPGRESASRAELGKLYDELNRTIAGATFEGKPMFDGECAVFDVEDARHNGEPLSVSLPDLSMLLRGERGLDGFLARARSRFDLEQMAEVLRAAVADGKAMLRESDRQLSVLLTHFHRQRHDPTVRGAEPDLAIAAAKLSERVMRAGSAAFAAQGELSTRASSLVLSDLPAK